MRNIRLIIGVLLVLAGVGVGSAQDYEYGKPAELKGLKKVFVNTGDDMPAREAIVAVIEKANLPDIELLDSSDDAEVMLLFVSGKEDKVFYVERLAYSKKVRAGTGQVFINGKSSQKKPRLLMSSEGVQDAIWKGKPSAKFAKAFVDAYKKANGLK